MIIWHSEIHESHEYLTKLFIFTLISSYLSLSNIYSAKVYKIFVHYDNDCKLLKCIL